GWLGEAAVPWSFTRTQAITIEKLNKFNRVWTFFNRSLTWYRVGQATYRIVFVDEEHRTLHGVYRLVLDDEQRLVERLDAKAMIYQPATKSWALVRASKWRLRPRVVHSKPTRLVLPESFDDFSRSIGDPQAMTSRRIWKQIRRLEGRGRELPYHRFAVHARASLPAASFFFALLALFLVGRSAWPTSPAGLLGGGLLLISVFWLLFSFGQLFSLVGTLPIWIGAWLPNIAALIVLALFSGLRNQLLHTSR
ncbi:MAG: LptF/LptG family permease, partial [Myxococcales bacterium]|nr:LptF/LptG family permease [Myxococcales bacterium]